MLKHALFLSGCSLFILIVGCLPARAIPTISLTVLDNEIFTGENFDVWVFVDGDNIGLELLSFGFDVETSGNIFTLDKAVVGSGFDNDSQWVVPEVAGSAFPGITADDCLLATLTLTAVDAGSGSLEIMGATDKLFYGLAYEIAPGTNDWYDINGSLDITVHAMPAEPVPEPATVLLFGLGGIGVFGMRKKVFQHCRAE